MSIKRLRNKIKYSVTRTELDEELSNINAGPDTIANELHLYNVPVQNISGGGTEIIWTNIVIMDDIFEFSPGTSRITINKDGWFKINVEMTLDNNSNSRSQAYSYIFHNGEYVSGSAMVSYHRNRNQGMMTVSATRVIQVSSGDTVHIESTKSGGSIATVTEGCRLTIEEII